MFRALEIVFPSGSLSTNVSTPFSFSNFSIQPAAEFAFTCLLFSVNALLDSLPGGSGQQITDMSVSEAYAQLEGDLSAVVAEFTVYGIEMGSVSLLNPNSLSLKLFHNL